MVERPAITPDSFFSNDLARTNGFTNEFWAAAYDQWRQAIANEGDTGFDNINAPRTLRMPFHEGYADVLIRYQPDMNEYSSIRFTAFPSDDQPTPRQIDAWYWDTESRQVIGEAVLLDANFSW